MGDTVGLSSLQIIISQKADNWGSIGSVKTVIGEMGHWEAPLWELLCGGERTEPACVDRSYGRLADRRCHTSTVNGKAVRRRFSFIPERADKKYISQMACGDDIITHSGRWWIGHHNWRLKVSGRNCAALNGQVDVQGFELLCYGQRRALWTSKCMQTQSVKDVDGHDPDFLPI